MSNYLFNTINIWRNILLPMKIIIILDLIYLSAVGLQLKNMQTIPIDQKGNAFLIKD